MEDWDGLDQAVRYCTNSINSSHPVTCDRRVVSSHRRGRCDYLKISSSHRWVQGELACFSVQKITELKAVINDGKHKKIDIKFFKRHNFAFSGPLWGFRRQLVWPMSLPNFDFELFVMRDRRIDRISTVLGSLEVFTLFVCIRFCVSGARNWLGRSAIIRLNFVLNAR